jgi:hypothetical protein
MLATDPKLPEPAPPGVRFSTLVWISLAAFTGVGAWEIFFGYRPPQADVNQRSQAARSDPAPSPPVRHNSRVILESQIARKSRKHLQQDGYHRFAVFNIGSAPLKMKAREESNSLRLEVPPEVPPGDFRYVSVHWRALDDTWSTPYRGFAEVLTDDPANKVIYFVIAEESDATE